MQLPVVPHITDQSKCICICFGAFWKAVLHSVCRVLSDLLPQYLLVCHTVGRSLSELSSLHSRVKGLAFREGYKWQQDSQKDDEYFHCALALNRHLLGVF
jgi:hypothetical protein